MLASLLQYGTELDEFVDGLFSRYRFMEVVGSWLLLLVADLTSGNWISMTWFTFCLLSLHAHYVAFMAGVSPLMMLTSCVASLDILVHLSVSLFDPTHVLLPFVANAVIYLFMVSFIRGFDLLTVFLWATFLAVDIYLREVRPVNPVLLLLASHSIAFGLFLLISELAAWWWGRSLVVLPSSASLSAASPSSYLASTSLSHPRPFPWLPFRGFSPSPDSDAAHPGEAGGLAAARDCDLAGALDVAPFLRIDPTLRASRCLEDHLDLCLASIAPTSATVEWLLRSPVLKPRFASAGGPDDDVFAQVNQGNYDLSVLRNLEPLVQHVSFDFDRRSFSLTHLRPSTEYEIRLLLRAGPYVLASPPARFCSTDRPGAVSGDHSGITPVAGATNHSTHPASFSSASLALSPATISEQSSPRGSDRGESDPEEGQADDEDNGDDEDVDDEEGEDDDADDEEDSTSVGGEESDGEGGSTGHDTDHGRARPRHTQARRRRPQRRHTRDEHRLTSPAQEQPPSAPRTRIQEYQDLLEQLEEEKITVKEAQGGLKKLKRDLQKNEAALKADLAALRGSLQREEGREKRERQRATFLAETIRQIETSNEEAEEELKVLREETAQLNLVSEKAHLELEMQRESLRRLEKQFLKIQQSNQKTLAELEKEQGFPPSFFFFPTSLFFS